MSHLEEIDILCDGGLRGTHRAGGVNSGRKAYGSFIIHSIDFVVRQERIGLGNAGTSLAAEALVIVAALTRTQEEIKRRNSTPASYAVKVSTDCDILVRILKGEGGEIGPYLKEPLARLTKVVSSFGEVTYSWVPREVSVARFGH